MVSITFQPTTEDRILFVGGGEVAERRIRLFIEEPCNIVVIAPVVTDRMANGQKKSASFGGTVLSPVMMNNSSSRAVCSLSAQIIIN